jgi:hypothetical protein
MASQVKYTDFERWIVLSVLICGNVISSSPISCSSAKNTRLVQFIVLVQSIQILLIPNDESYLLTKQKTIIMKSPKFLMTAALAVLFFGSCKKSGSDDSTATASGMQFQLGVTNPLVTVNKVEAPNTILWTSGSAYATQVKLEAKQNASQVEFKSTTPAQINLFASVAASLGNVTLPAGTYSEVEFKISVNTNGSVPSLELNGNYTNASNQVIPITFTMNSLFELKTEQSNVTVTSNTSFTALTTLNLQVVSAGITQAMLNSATLTSGKIIISASSNSNLYNIIVNNLRQSHHVDITHH